MKSEGVEGLPADPDLSQAANDEFADRSEGLARLTRSRAGWDPYDVWRTRVKNSSQAQERDADSQR
jgi:hypothetical protein